MEDEPLLNAGIGATLNSAGEVELDAGVMEGTTLRVGGAACLRDVRHPIDLAVAVMEDGRHVLLAANGASRFAREHGLEMADPSIFITDRKRQKLLQGADTVGAVARDSGGHIAVAVSTGGRTGKLPGRIGDSPIASAGFYADDRFGAVCGTGLGEAFIRLGLARLVVVELQHGMEPAAVAQGAIDHLGKAMQAGGGVLVTLALKRAGVSHLFTLNGGHIWPVLVGAAEHGIRIIDVRHEQSAAFAAEGWAKVTRECGVAAVTAGPGVTNSTSALAQAMGNDSPLFVIGGRAPIARWGMGSLQEMDHVEVVRSLTKKAATVMSPDDAYATAADLVRVALSRRTGPVFMDIPIDVYFGAADYPEATEHLTVDPGPPPDHD